MLSNQLSNKKIALFGLSNNSKNFINYLNKYNIFVFIVDENGVERDILNSNLVKYISRKEIIWKEIDCLIINKDNKTLIETALKNNCEVISEIEFFEKYFPEYNYIALIGESGSLISADMLKYLFCKKQSNFDYEACIKDDYLTIKNFGKTNNYIIKLDDDKISLLQSPHFNNIILFDLNYNKSDIEKIKNIFFNQNEEDFAIINIDDKEVKNFYNFIKNNENCSSRIIPISINKILKNGISFVNNEIYINLNDKTEEYVVNEFKNLTGNQNKTNILSAFAFFQIQRMQPQEIIENLYNFKPSNDVFEVINHEENFTFINDIKNKNKFQSLISFDNIYWILCLDEISFEFSEFSKLTEYFSKIKYVFILGKYNEELLEIFRENEIEYFILYNMKDIFQKIKKMIDNEKKEEKITILLSSMNDIENSKFYEKCGKEFEKLSNKINDGE